MEFEIGMTVEVKHESSSVFAGHRGIIAGTHQSEGYFVKFEHRKNEVLFWPEELIIARGSGETE